jgi:AcrR family transcriptional regulator
MKGQILAKSEQAANKADEIIQVASRLFSEKGYSATSLQEIANLVGLHKTSLFHYFENKESILMGVMDKPIKKHLNFLDDIVDNPNLNAREKLKQALKMQVQVTCEYREHINVWLTEIRSLSLQNRGIYNRKRKEYELRFEKIVKEVQADKETSLFKGVDPKVATLAILGMSNWLLKWYHPAGRLTPEEIFDAFYRVISQGNSIPKR